MTTAPWAAIPSSSSIQAWTPPRVWSQSSSPKSLSKAVSSISRTEWSRAAPSSWVGAVLTVMRLTLPHHTNC